MNESVWLLINHLRRREQLTISRAGYQIKATAEPASLFAKLFQRRSFQRLLGRGQIAKKLPHLFLGWHLGHDQSLQRSRIAGFQRIDETQQRPGDGRIGILRRCRPCARQSQQDDRQKIWNANSHHFATDLIGNFTNTPATYTIAASNGPARSHRNYHPDEERGSKS